MTPRPRDHRRWSWQIGRVAGVDVRLHVSFFLLVLLVLASAGTVDGGAIAALGWLVAVFACVLFHELSHCVVARRRGAGVEEIMLLPFGGVSRMTSIPEAARDEMAIAIAGPLASLVLALLSALAAVALGDRLLPVDLFEGSWFVRLCWFNLLVAAFNLLPAFPLDGGRVFRAALERRLDRERATHLAARLGRRFAVVLIFLGLFWNIWLIVIGVFVFMGASTEEAVTVLHLRLAGRTVADLMLLDPVILSAEATVADGREALRHTAQRVFPVTGPAGYVGLVEAAALDTAEPDQRIGELADADARALRPEAPIDDDILSELGPAQKALVVLEAGRVVGLLRVEDISHAVEQPPPRASSN